jgi:hypothetical protein
MLTCHAVYSRKLLPHQLFHCDYIKTQMANPVKLCRSFIVILLENRAAIIFIRLHKQIRPQLAGWGLTVCCAFAILVAYWIFYQGCKNKLMKMALFHIGVSGNKVHMPAISNRYSRAGCIIYKMEMILIKISPCSKLVNMSSRDRDGLIRYSRETVVMGVFLQFRQPHAALKFVNVGLRPWMALIATAAWVTAPARTAISKLAHIGFTSRLNRLMPI